jgi:AcrR family transcriptional regulator
MAGLPLRKDALRSRNAILAAAEECLAADTHASFAEIAFHAGVSHATVYRHFADRQALLLALLDTSMEKIEEQVDSWDIGAESLDALLALMATEQARFQGLLSTVRQGEVDAGDVERLTTRARDMFRDPLAAAKKAKRVRSDLTVEDVISLLRMIDGALTAVSGRAERKDAALWALDVIKAGIADRGD